MVSARWWVWIMVPGGPSIAVLAGALDWSDSELASSGVGYLRHGAGLRFALVGDSPLCGFTLPLIYPFGAVAILTLHVWRSVPKFPRGHCRRCGYNLTGLTEARCPECGAGFVR